MAVTRDQELEAFKAEIDLRAFAADLAARAALALGIALKADLLPIDERRRYAATARKGHEVTGTLGSLDLAAKRKLIHLKHTIELLKQTNFRYRKEIIESLPAEHQNS